MGKLVWQVHLVNKTPQSQIETPYPESVKAGSTLALPDAGTQLWIKTDYTELCIESVAKPDWATGIGRDDVGLFVTVPDKKAERRVYWMNPGRYPVEDHAGKHVGDVMLEQGYFQDQAEFFMFQKHGFRQPSWADVIGTDKYGLYAEVNIKQVIQRFRWIAPGRFWMGSPESEVDRGRDEIFHEVIVTKAYWLADTVCTQALWQVVIGGNPSYFKGEQRPLERVSWQNVRDFINKLNQFKPGWELRLPTEAEWEYACRAGTNTPFSFGGNVTPARVNYCGDHYYADGKKGLYRRETVVVKTLPPNAWGLYEMHGNVWEWCQDWYGDYPTQFQLDPQGPNTGDDRVLRGGGWYNGGGYVRAAYRLNYRPSDANSNTGFRLARSQTS